MGPSRALDPPSAPYHGLYLPDDVLGDLLPDAADPHDLRRGGVHEVLPALEASVEKEPRPAPSDRGVRSCARETQRCEMSTLPEINAPMAWQRAAE